MKNQLDELPPSNNSYWEGADVRTGIVPKKHFLDQPHYFNRVDGHQAQCNHCWWGFELEPGDKIINGHLYDVKGKLVL